ncbi:MAG: hypothetical protein AB7N76_08195 [Planctomycetota bacterium]
MSDHGLRTLRRELAGGGGPEEEAELLLAALRAGALDPARVRLAARLGSAAAALIAAEHGWAPAPSLAPHPTAAELIAWSEPLADAGREAACRCGLALARLLLPEWERQSGRLHPRWRSPGTRGRPRLDPRPAELCHALEAWLRAPAPASEAALERAWAACEEVTFLRPEDWRARAGLTAVLVLLRAARADPAGAVRLGHDALHPHPAAALLAALRAEVLPWALGQRDPLG